MMTVIRMFLLVVMVPCSLAKNEKDPHSHVIDVLGGTGKCSHYIMKEGKVMEVKYRVLNTGPNTETIDFLVHGPKEFINLKQVNRKFGSVLSSVAGDYKICFVNRNEDTKYVVFDFIIEGDTKCVVELEDTKTVITDLRRMAHNHKDVKDFLRVIDDNTNINEDILFGKFTVVCFVCFVFFWLSNICLKQKQKEKTEVESNRRKRWKKDRKQHLSPLNIQAPIKTEGLVESLFVFP